MHGGSFSGSIERADEGFTDSYVQLPFIERRPRWLTPYLGLVFYFAALASYIALLLFGHLFFEEDEALKVYIGGHVALLSITGLLQLYLSHYQEHCRKQGYLEFYHRMWTFVNLPFVIIAFGTGGAAIGALWKDLTVAVLTVPTLLRINLAIEAGVVASILGFYTWSVKKQQTSTGPPDMQQLLASALHLSRPIHYSYGEMDNYSLQMLELIRVQQDRLVQLNKEVLRLQQALDQVEGRAEAGSSQLDVEHVLAGKQQEVRAMTAERNQLMAEIRMAQSMIAEQESDIQRLRGLNQQHVDESARLRAMLDEWSTRNAKLELALVRTAPLHNSDRNTMKR